MSRGFRGTTQECLNHLGKQLPDSDVQRGAFYDPIAKYTRRSNATVGRWFKGESAIEGESLLRLRYYLAKSGYQVTDLEVLTPAIRELGRIIAEGRVEIETVVETVVIDRDQLYRTLLRGVMPLEDRLEKIIELVKESGGEVSTPNVVAKEERAAITDLNREDVIVALARLIQAATPLAQAVVSDAYSVEDRQRLRTLTGEGGVYRLSTIMNRLCSETARGQLREYRG